MDVNRQYSRNQMDYDMDHPNPKLDKMSCNEDRVDSGLDSLKEEEFRNIVEDMESLNMAAVEPTRNDNNEPWKKEVTEDGDTFLHLAIIHEAKEQAIQMINLSPVIMEQPKIVEKLLVAGCDPLLVDSSGNTALHIACKRGSMLCFAVLTQVCPKHLPSILKAPNYSGHNCLHLASIHGFLSLVESLIRLGADVDAQEQCNGRTALHLAVDLQNPELVKLLVTSGADVNSLTYGGYTPYHLTFGRQNGEIRQQLHDLTAQELRELPESESESEDSDVEAQSEDDEMYDDIHFVGH
ncbi:hypothetical protein AGOR_G00087000 [Albula goreensis]|uniref:NF-kappa-B inhibitor alpha n=1 Tax=Albula goreensis TaxID=1534307 RepID=A0A8T3DNP9_9TELE|nr:hypothetical protein AGOR_G00087000 [Albula goreensis]